MFQLLESTEAHVASITLARLREVLSYDAETGIFRWRLSLSSKRTAGDVAGSLDGGRIYIGMVDAGDAELPMPPSHYHGANTRDVWAAMLAAAPRINAINPGQGQPSGTTSGVTPESGVGGAPPAPAAQAKSREKDRP